MNRKCKICKVFHKFSFVFPYGCCLDCQPLYKMHALFQLDFQASADHGALDTYVPNGEWHLIGKLFCMLLQLIKPLCFLPSLIISSVEIRCSRFLHTIVSIKHLFQLNLKLNSESGGDTSTFIPNGEWYLVGKSIPCSLNLCEVFCVVPYLKYYERTIYLMSFVIFPLGSACPDLIYSCKLWLRSQLTIHTGFIGQNIACKLFNNGSQIVIYGINCRDRWRPTHELEQFIFLDFDLMESLFYLYSFKKQEGSNQHRF